MFRLCLIGSLFTIRPYAYEGRIIPFDHPPGIPVAIIAPAFYVNACDNSEIALAISL